MTACRAAVLRLRSAADIPAGNRFGLMFTHSRDIILFMDRFNGRILEANAAAIGAYGYSHKELLCLTIHDLRAGSTRHLTDEQMAQADAEGILFETLHRRKDGSIFPVEVSSQGAAIDQQRILVSIVRDITDRKQAEEALQTAMQKAEEGKLMLEAILANLPAGLIVTGGPPDFPISRVSRYGARLASVSEAEMIGIPAGLHFQKLKILLPDGITPAGIEQMPLYRAARFGEETSNYELMMELPEGRKIPVAITAAPVRNADGQIVAAISTWSDISRIKKTEEMLRQKIDALRLNESKFQSIFQNAPFAMTLSALDDGAIVEVNDAWCRLMEYDREEVIGKLPQELDLESVLTISEHLQNALEQDGYLRHHELETRSKSGKALVLSCSIEAVIIRDTPYLVNSIENITEQKRAEKALQQYARELERSNHDLQEFAFVASHDLQEPLRKIEAFSDILLEETNSLNERQTDLLNRLQKSAVRMRGMVTGLLQLSRLTTEAQPFQEVDLNRSVREVLYDLDRRIQLCGAIMETGELPVIEADPLQIHLLLQNLIANALKFQPPGAAPYVRVYATQPNDYSVNLIVKDNGIGFDAEHVEHIFQPFRRFVNRRDYEGSGMGLAICRKIAERHGGKIGVESRLGQGAVFTVTLPLRQAGLDRYQGVI